MSRKVALITGASRGIGEAIAKKLSQEYDIVINYAHRKENAQQVLRQLADGNHHMIQCDVSNEFQVKEMMNEILTKYGRIDVLINNAGITKDNILIRMSEEEFEHVIDINLKGTYHCIRHVAKTMMKQRNGKIINMASVVGLCGNIGQVNYAASKGGVIAMTKAVAKELAPRGICVNAVAPGFIETEMTAQLSDAMKETAISSIAMKRFGKAEEIAGVVKFLCSDDSNYITGQVITVDGGMVM